MSDSVRPHRQQPTRLPHPWDSPGKNTGVGCHFLLQCKKVKSESKVIPSCPTLQDPMDCILPGSSVHGIFQARVLQWVAIAFSEKPCSSTKLNASSNKPFHGFHLMNTSLPMAEARTGSLFHMSVICSAYQSVLGVQVGLVFFFSPIL